MRCEMCYGAALKEAESPVGNYLVSGIGIVFVALGRRILDGNPRVFPARHELGSHSPHARKE